MVSKKKTSQKKKSVKVSKEPVNSVEEEKTCRHCNCWSSILNVKLAAMAFILFLVTVWTSLGNALLSVHWGWYLGLTVLFSVFAYMKCGRKKC